MNQRQPIKTPRNLRRQETPSRLPPVLFSLPNLSETTRATPVAPPADPIATVSTRIPLVTPPSDSAHLLQDQRQDQRREQQPKEKSASLLNAAIGFLALALMLIGAKLYSDRASESSRAAQRTRQNTKAENSIAENSISLAPETVSSSDPDPGFINNLGPQRATYQVPLVPQSNRSAFESEPTPLTAIQTDPSDKPTLEISEPLGYRSEGPQGQIQRVQFQSEALPQGTMPSASEPFASMPMESLPPAPQPFASVPVAPAPAASMTNASALGPGAAPRTSSPPATFTPNAQNAISAASLNTRDMIRLRQGKPVEMTNREPGPSSAIQLSGETYPPVRQKYEPLSLPQTETLPTDTFNARTYNGEVLPSRPTSMEIPPPPKPYQPIGTAPTP